MNRMINFYVSAYHTPIYVDLSLRFTNVHVVPRTLDFVLHFVSHCEEIISPSLLIDNECLRMEEDASLV